MNDLGEVVVLLALARPMLTAGLIFGLGFLIGMGLYALL